MENVIKQISGKLKGIRAEKGYSLEEMVKNLEFIEKHLENTRIIQH